MRKAIALLILLSSLSFVSCRGKYSDTSGVVSRFLNGFDISCSVYNSLCPEGTEGYIDDGMRKILFITEDFLPYDYTLAFNSRLDCVFELGVFLSHDTSERLALGELCLSRINLLESQVRGEGRVLIENDLVIYIFSEDIEKALDKLERVL